MVREEIPSYRLSSLSFGIYSSQEIKDLSVKEITNPQSFDALMHPTHGGLYDPALGPNDRNDACTTCGQLATICPGHMGHIILPLPIYNPVLFPTLVKLLKGTCFQCHRLSMSHVQSVLLEYQIKALNRGLLTIVEEMQTACESTKAETGSGDNEAMKEEVEPVLKDMLALASQNVDREAMLNGSNVKNVIALKQTIVKKFLNGKYFNGTKCALCKMPMRKLRAEHHSKLYFSKGLLKKNALKIVEEKKKQITLKRLMAQGETPEMEDVEMETEELNDEKEVSKLMDQSYLTPDQAMSHLQQVWTGDKSVLKWVLGALGVKKEMEFATDVFFLDVMPVAPSRFRPISVMKGKNYENQQTSNLSRVISMSNTVRDVLGQLRELSDSKEQDTNSMLIAQQEQGKSKNDIRSALMEKLQNAWIQLQTSANCVVDSDLDKLSTEKFNGIKQLLEKKDGLFRKHMMGKRVDFAARSVISPDPYISTNEIGIPLVFAKKLTYPQPVTPWNFHELKQAVINGPDVHPGACFVIEENGKRIRLSGSDKTQREAIAKQLLTPSANNDGNISNKQVERHLKNGDLLLLNRQPTLHKPSIQAHKARVLPGQKTLRLHYANCKAYNADFDGDEMNAHFPQNEIGRAEAMNIALTDYQYLVPKDGTPLAGLIQDHMVAGVTLMIRGRFFGRQDYQQLVFSSLSDASSRIMTLPPAMLKPRPLWSGKQIISTLLLNLVPKEKPPPNLVGKAKVSGKNWNKAMSRMWVCGGSRLQGDNMSESEVVIRGGELLVGVLDKGHYGNTPYGLVHCFYELYGGAIAGRLLTCLARLFTCFLQLRGFTLGVEDILVNRHADHKRRKIMKEGSKSGNEVAAKALNVKNAEDNEKLKSRLQEAHFAKDDGEMKDLDLSMKGKTDEIQNEIVKVIMPIGLYKKFPDNNLQLMVQSGAKGSSVNCMQISCLLGQIELEGRRPPIMISGRSLPSFQPYETCPRAGGFIDGRFLTGIRPQEYFFHCMAGREGLVDTAVKTSRSGYLQRCIIKHLEGITVNYDMTVRDSDGSIIQFAYGEDGLDIPKTQYLNKKQFPFLIQNEAAVISDKQMREIRQSLDTESASHLFKKVKKWQKKRKTHGTSRLSPFMNFCEKKLASVTEEVGSAAEGGASGRKLVTQKLCEKWQHLSEEKKAKYTKQAGHCPDPVSSRLRPDRYFGSISEYFDSIIDEYISSNPHKLIKKDEEKVSTSSTVTADRFKTLMHVRNLDAVAHPGEPVGLLAAQSIGEPSTQMTLNTFHFAGRGEMNVTLGIPRLREILMVASATIKTPNMDIPLRRGEHAEAAAKDLKLKLCKVHLNQVVEDVKVKEKLSVPKDGDKCRLYNIRINFLPPEMYDDEVYVSPSKILQYMEKRGLKQIQEAIKKKLLESAKQSLLATAKVRNRPTFTSETAGAAGGNEDEDVSDDDQHDNDATATKRRERQTEELDYQGEEEEQTEMQDDGLDVGNKESDEDEDNEDEERSSEEDDQDQPETLHANSPTKRKKKKKAIMDQKRITTVLSNVNMAVAYAYDPADELWCEITYRMAIGDKLDVTSLLEDLLKQIVVHSVPGINRGFLSTSKNPADQGLTRLKTEGCNIKIMYQYDNILDLNKLYTNDIHAIANTYGIEAANKAIIKEIRDVFAAYGIEVNYHHLSLIADYMTFEGTYRPFNRVGIESNASALQKMSFETTMSFLKTATLLGAKDTLQSPSARLVVGKLVGGGTGCFDLVQPSPV